LFHAGDYIGAAEPVGFGKIGLRPLCRVIGMRVIEADDVFSALAALALDADQIFRINVVTVVRRVGAGVSGARGGGHDTGIVSHLAKQHAAALVGIGFFAVAANGFVVGFPDL